MYHNQRIIELYVLRILKILFQELKEMANTHGRQRNESPQCFSQT